MNKVFNLVHVGLKVEFITDESGGIVKKNWEIHNYNVIIENVNNTKRYTAGGYKGNDSYIVQGYGSYSIKVENVNKVFSSVAGNMAYVSIDIIENKRKKVNHFELKKKLEQEALNKLLERHQYYLDFASSFKNAE